MEAEARKGEIAREAKSKTKAAEPARWQEHFCLIDKHTLVIPSTLRSAISQARLCTPVCRLQRRAR